MVRKILIDAGLNGRTACSGRTESGESSPAWKIGEALSDALEQMGYEVLFSGNVPELCEREDGVGRPAACASVAGRWHADCVLRLCIRSAPDPGEGSAEALVFRRRSDAWSLAESVLQQVELGSELKNGGVRPASGVLLLRRTACPGVILVLKLPFCRKESLNRRDAAQYADCIAKGVDAWAQTAAGVPGTSVCRYPYCKA